jgi:hypothetical protein
MTGVEPPVPADESPAARPRANSVVAVVTCVLLVAAVALSVVAWREISAASDARDTAAGLDAARHRSAARAGTARRQLHAVHAAVTRAESTLDALGAALDAAGTSQNHMVEVQNHGVDLSNNGDPNGASAVFANDGQSALNDLTQKTTAVHQALTDAGNAVQALEHVDG